MKKVFLATLLAVASSFAASQVTSWTAAATVTSIAYQEGAGADAGKTILMVGLSNQVGNGLYVRSDSPSYAVLQANLESALTSKKLISVYSLGYVPFTFSGASGAVTTTTWNKIVAVQKTP